MKKSNLLIVSTLLFVLVAMACVEKPQKVARNSQNLEGKTFTSIKSEIVGKIVFTQSAQTKVEAEGTDDMLNNLVVEIEDGRLDLRMQGEKLSKGSEQKLTVRVSSPYITSVNMSGVGSFEFSGKVEADKLNIKLSGVGSISADDLKCDHITANSEGVGSIVLKGSTNTVNIKSNSVGKIDADKLEAKKAIVNASGVGSISCYASERVEISSFGIGSVTYYGNPVEKEISKNGIGKIKAGN